MRKVAHMIGLTGFKERFTLTLGCFVPKAPRNDDREKRMNCYANPTQTTTITP